MGNNKSIIGKSLNAIALVSGPQYFGDYNNFKHMLKVSGTQLLNLERPCSHSVISSQPLTIISINSLQMFSTVVSHIVSSYVLITINIIINSLILQYFNIHTHNKLIRTHNGCLSYLDNAVCQHCYLYTITY